MSTKPAIHLSDPAEMLRARLHQPRITSAQARQQRQHLERVVETTAEAAKVATSQRGRSSGGG